MMIGKVIQWPSWATKSMSSRPLVWCRRSRLKVNAQSSRINHWLRPTTYSTSTEPQRIARNAHVAPSSVAAQAIQRRTRASMSTDHHSPPQLEELYSATSDGG